jgi:hypothetical protein
MAVFQRITKRTPGDRPAIAEALDPTVDVRAVDFVAERLLP